MLIYLFHGKQAFLQVISFLQVKLASQKDNCKSYILTFVEKFDRI